MLEAVAPTIRNCAASRDLPRDLVTDDPDLAAAHLAHRLIPVPPARAATTLTHYTALTRAAAAPTVSTALDHQAPSPTPEPIGLVDTRAAR